MNTADAHRTLRRALENLQADVRRQIQAYPPPIPACDAQFNHLLALRAALPAELDRLDRLSAAGTLNVADFLASSPVGGDLGSLLRAPMPPKSP